MGRAHLGNLVDVGCTAYLHADSAVSLPGVIALRGAFSSRDSGSRAASVLAMVGVINIPIIKYSVDWWYTLHQPATFTITGRAAMTMDMWAPLLIMVLGFYSFFIALTLMRTRSEILRREANKRWVRELAEETN